MAYHILANSEVLNLNFFFIVSSLSGFGSILQQILDFRAKQWIKDIIKKCCSWARTTNIGLLYLKVRNNLWDILIDVPQPEYWRGCVPGIPAGLTPVLSINIYIINMFSTAVENRQESSGAFLRNPVQMTYLTLGQSSQTCCCIIWKRPGPSCIVFISWRQLHLRVPDAGLATGLYRTTWQTT